MSVDILWPMGAAALVVGWLIERAYIRGQLANAQERTMAALCRAEYAEHVRDIRTMERDAARAALAPFRTPRERGPSGRFQKQAQS